MLRYGVSVICDERGMALRGVVAVYAADVLLHELKLADGELAGEHISGAVVLAIRRAGDWLAERAGEASAPPSAPRRAPTARLRPRQPGRGSDTPAPLRVPGVVDPGVGAEPEDTIDLRADSEREVVGDEGVAEPLPDLKQDRLEIGGGPDVPLGEPRRRRTSRAEGTEVGPTPKRRQVPRRVVGQTEGDLGGVSVRRTR